MWFSFKHLCRSTFKSKGPVWIVLRFIAIFIIANVFMMFLLQYLSLIKWQSQTKDNYILRYFREPNVEGSQSEVVKNLNLVAANENNLTSKIKKKVITISEFIAGHKTGNPLIDEYGLNDSEQGGLGRGVVLTVKEKPASLAAMNEYHLNTVVSDLIPLNRKVPDSRIRGCENLKYGIDLPTVSIIIPFYNEWPSVLIRTIYSVIVRSPRELVKEIILIDDTSSLDVLGQWLEDYIRDNFPEGLVRLLRMPERSGLIAARMRGCRAATGDVLIIFDSHMEVNIDWLPPLLTEVARDRKTVSMATLDYIQPDTFEYRYNLDYLTRYGWNWKLIFFETFFRDDQVGPEKTSPRPGATMVGAAFAMDRQYFFELGGYDEGMKVWGGENLEMTWRVWLCGGRLLHVPCSRIGHVARVQPYEFPGGRMAIEHYNYKRAFDVWMGNYTRFIYPTFPDMKSLDAGNITHRLALKDKLACKDFSWYLHNVWPELNIPDENVTMWGEVFNEGNGNCLDNNGYLFQAEMKLYLHPCAKSISNQVFSLTKDNLLRTTLQCLVAHKATEGTEVRLEDCIIGTRDKWKYLQDHSIIHLTSNLCLDVDSNGPVLKKCQPSQKTQRWLFRPITFTN